MKKILFVVLVLFMASNFAFSAIKISPSYLEFDVNKTPKDYITGAFSVAGGANETVRFKVYPEFFEHDEKGRYISLEDKGQFNSLMGKINFFPNEFTCANGKEQKVRITVNSLKTLPSGESRVVLFLEDVDAKEVILNRSANGIGGKLIVKTRVGVPIFVDKGNYSKRGTIETLALNKRGDKYDCEYKIASLGNSKIRYNGYAQLIKGDELIEKFEINGRAVQGGKSFDLIQQLPISQDKLVEGQEYKLKLVLVYTDEKQKEKFLTKEVTFIHGKTVPSQV